MPVWDEATDVLTSGKTSVVEVIDEDVVSTLNISVVKKSTPGKAHLLRHTIIRWYELLFWYAYSQS
jgi:hypothetical protein